MSDDLKPSRLPATEDDLAEWSVYADHLLTIGDPLGNLLATELALPVAPHDGLGPFHELARRFCKRWRHTPAAWCLGHVRTLDLPAVRLPAVGLTYVTASAGALARATDIVKSPIGRLLETLTFAYDATTERAHWKRLLAALPPTCRRWWSECFARHQRRWRI